MTNLPVSHHIFIYPFRWDILLLGQTMEGASFKDRTKIDDFVEILGKDKWQSFDDHIKEPIAFYNDALFFYDSVRKSIFGNLLPEKPNSGMVEVVNLSLKLELENPLHYKIATHKFRKYVLDVNKIRLNVYNSGIAMLAFHLTNRKKSQSDSESILRINDFGRRLFPTFLTVEDNLSDTKLLRNPQKKATLPLSISMPPVFNENYSEFLKIKEIIKKQPNVLPNGSQELLKGVLGTSFKLESNRDLTKKEVIVRPTLDDRMFAVCWYGNDEESKKIQWDSRSKTYGFQKHELSDYWMRFLFMESDISSAQSRLFRLQLADRHTYHRWADYGTFYGITPSTFVCLSDRSKYALENTVRHMQRLYAEMGLLILAQKASVQRFSDEIALLRLKDDEHLLNSDEVRFLRKQYVDFINHLHFRAITPTEQGHELYQMLQSSMEMAPSIAKIDREIGEFEKLLNRLEEERRFKQELARQKMEDTRNDWASFYLPASLLLGILGMSTLDDKFSFCGGKVHWKSVISFGIVLIMLLVFYFRFVKKCKK